MLSSIHPLGERARHNRWGLTVAAHVVGSWLGGVTVFTGAALVGRLVPSGNGATVALTAAGVAVSFEAAKALRLGERIPGPRRQVNEDWLNRYRGWVYGFGFGFQLGAGVLTIVTTAATYLALGLTAATRDAGAGALVGSVFGLTRALPLLAARRVDRPERLRDLHARIRAVAKPMEVVSTAAVAVLAAAAVSVVIGEAG